jgi:hypothetical protein
VMNPDMTDIPTPTPINAENPEGSSACAAASYAAHEHTVNFGALPPMPPGYQVIWSPGLEHYLWVNDEGQEGLISWDRYWCRRSAFAHHAAQAA